MPKQFLLVTIAGAALSAAPIAVVPRPDGEG
jgi:hypothetical protein